MRTPSRFRAAASEAAGIWAVLTVISAAGIAACIGVAVVLVRALQPVLQASGAW